MSPLLILTSAGPQSGRPAHARLEGRASALYPGQMTLHNVPEWWLNSEPAREVAF